MKPPFFGEPLHKGWEQLLILRITKNIMINHHTLYHIHIHIHIQYTIYNVQYTIYNIQYTYIHVYIYILYHNIHITHLFINHVKPPDFLPVSCAPSLLSHLRRLQAQQAAADDRGATAGCGAGDDGVLGHRRFLGER